MTDIPNNSKPDSIVSASADKVGINGGTETEPIAIIGIGCRFPGAKDPEAFWQLLCDGRDSIIEVPADRWDVDAFYDPAPGARNKMNTRWGGFLDQVDQFDAQFFGISPREAARMDPQQRLLLEVAWEALEDAGQVPERLGGTQTGVFIGISGSDYGRLQIDPRLSDAYMPTGNANSIAANRLSYVFNFHGPSMIVDTACSSSLVAIYLACQSLWNGKSALALAGGVSVILSPTITINFSKAGMLSPDGRCKAFDAGANGFVRGEGAGIVILKHLSRALADGDPVYAVIRGCAVNSDGRSNGLTAPNQEAQEAVVLEACRRAEVSPGHIDYVEAHGTGTPVGDPVEAKALGTVLATDRPPGRPCILGSVKTNIGHSEAAAGIAGLIKVALMLKRRAIPPHLHFHEPNPQIPFSELPLRVQTTLSPWPEESRPALAGVNSFGFGGTNAHVILEGIEDRRSKIEDRAPPSSILHPPSSYVLPLSAHSPEALQSLCLAYKDFLMAEEAGSLVPLQDVCYTASVRRSHHDHRLAIVGHDRGELIERLEAFLRAEPRPGMSSGRKNAERPVKLVFVFPGQGSQWWAMGRQLLEQESVFRENMERCGEMFQQYADWSLLNELMADESQSRLDETEIAQPALFALQVALAALWRSWGIVPDAVVGHSAGEVAAANVAGVLSLEDATWVMFHRGRLMQRATGQGKMAAVELSWEEATCALEGYENRLSIAAHNSPTSTTLSGDPAALEAVLQPLQQRGILVRMLPVNYAFHSSQMEPFLGELVEALQGLQLRPITLPIFSTVTGRASNGQDFDAAYWARNVREPVLFSTAVDRLIEEDHNIFLELSPHPTLFGPVSQCLRHRSKEGAILPSLRREGVEQAVMLGTLGALYTLGYPVDWSKLYPAGGRCVQLPSYPWQRERHWLEIDEAEIWERAWTGPSSTKAHPLLGRHLKSAHPVWEIELDRQFLPYLDDHRIQGAVVLPATAYVEMALAAAEAFAPGAHVLSELEFQRVLFLPENETRQVQVILSPDAVGEASFYIYSKPGGTQQPHESWTLHATGRIRLDQDRSAPPVLGQAVLEEIRARCPEEISRRDFYPGLQEKGLQYGPSFQAVEQVWRGNREALGQLRVPQALESDVEVYQFHPAILDACLHVFEATDGGHGGVYLPIRIGSVRMYDRPGLRLWSHARLRPYVERSANVLEGEVRVLDEAGRLLMELSGLRLQQVDRSALPAGENPRNWLYELVWEPKTRPGQAVLHRPPDYMPSPHHIAERVQPRVAPSGVPQGLEPYEELGAQINVLSTAYVLKVFQQLGRELRPSQRVSVAFLAEQWGVASQHRRFLGRLLERLEEEGMLKNAGSEWEVSQVPKMKDTDELLESLLVRYPACEMELTYIERCGQHLAEVLRGECDPLQLLFPDGSLTAAEKFYQGSPFNRAYNILAQEVISTALERLPEDRTVRILEIGAGTGGTTAYVLPKLLANRTEYVFTDVSKLFTLHAEQKFHDHHFVRYQLLDIERDPGEQGFAAHSFDVILAPLVLHATTDLRQTLKNVQQLLASEGLLVLLEVESPQGVCDLVFSMTEGWWKFADVDLRPSHPLLSQRKWRNLLQEVGFTEAAAIPQREDGREGDWSRQVVILARGPRVEREAQSVEAISTRPERRGSWLIFTDSGDVGQTLAELLRSHGERCVMVSPAETYESLSPERYQLNPARPDDIHRLVKEALGPDEPPCRGVVHLWSLEAPLEQIAVGSLEAAQILGCGSVLHLVQTLAKVDWTEWPRLWLVTRGAQAVRPGAESVSVAQAPLWGFGTVIAMEHSELRCTNVDLSPRAAPVEIQSLFQEFWSGDHENQIALRHDARYVHRLVRSSPKARLEKRRVAPEVQPFRLEISTPGILDSLTLRATTRRGPGPGEVEIQVCVTGLNFRDVMKALGMYPSSPDELRQGLGVECAGKIVAIGEGVEDFQIGDEVVAMAPACFSAFVTTRASFVAPKPAHLSFEEAATIPAAFLTAHYALHHVARLSSGERVLIHAAAGGVGLAAVQLAQQAGAEIFATAGSPEKREFLQALGVKHVMDSRSLSFADEVMERTGGKGVDVVLNSLAGEFIPKSLSIMAPYGRFLEIGKRDIHQNSKLGLAHFQNNLSFSAIEMNRLFQERPVYAKSLFREVMQNFQEGTLKPLPLLVFPISEVESAFRYMAQAKHIGKIVVSLQEQEVLVAPASEETTTFRSDGTYLITGGLGGFGLTVAQWMVQQGARHLVLMGRSEPSAEAQQALERMREAGAQVLVAKADVAQQEQVANILSEIAQSMPPLRGIVHAAMILADAPLSKLNMDRLKAVMAPKMIGAWNLHTLTMNGPLDFFVLFSSAASVFGFPGQSNYVAANSFMEALAHYRRAQDLPAMVINWGRLDEVGYVARNAEVSQRLERLGTKGFTPKQAVTILERLLQQNPIQMCVVRTNWQQYRQQLNLSGRTLLSHLADETTARAPREQQGSIGHAIHAANPSEQQPLMEAHLQKEVARALLLDPSRLDLQTPLNALGVDSLLGLELKNRMETDLGVTLPMARLLQGPTISQLATEVLALLPESSSTTSFVQTGEAGAPHPITRNVSQKDAKQLLAKVDQLSDKEVDSLLLDLVNEKQEEL